MHTISADLLYPGIPVVEKIIRTIIVYAFLLIGLRLAGKRELTQLNPFDLVVLLTISNTVQNAIIGEDNSVTGGLIGHARYVRRPAAATPPRASAPIDTSWSVSERFVAPRSSPQRAL